MEKICFYQGSFKQLDEINVSPLDLGFTRSFGIFEYLRVYENVPFQMSRHVKRLLNAAKYFEISIPYSFEDICSLTQKLIDKSPSTNFGIKYFLTPGVSEHGLLPDPHNHTFLIYMTNPTIHSDECYKKGICLKSVPALRVFPEVKTSNYMAGSFYLNKYRKRGYDDIVYKNEAGKYLEGVTANLFLIKGNTLITPHEDILPGVTRAVILDSTQDHFDIELRSISKQDLKEADGAFFTSTNMEVLPIKQIDSYVIGNGKVPKSCYEIMTIYKNYVQESIKDYCFSSC